jgi:hypothetical protein
MVRSFVPQFVLPQKRKYSFGALKKKKQLAIHTYTVLGNTYKGQPYRISKEFAKVPML